MKEVSVDSESIVRTDELNGVSRRRFIGSVGAAVGAIGAAPLLGGGESTAEAAPGSGGGSSIGPKRMNDCFAYRRDAAINSRVNVSQSGNGDLTRYSDFSGMY